MTSPLISFEPFNSLPAAVLEGLDSKVTLKAYPKDTYVFNQGQPSLDTLFLIVSGLAQITVQGEKGVSSTVGFRHPGQFFGETVLLSGKRYPASMKAVKDLTCYLLQREVFEDLLQHHREFAGFFSHILTDRLRDLYHELVLEQPTDIYGLTSEPFKKRVADIMSYPVVTCFPDMPVNEIARIFSQHKISSVAVTGSNGKLVGLVSERDLISKVLALDSNPVIVHAADIMDKDPALLPPDAFFYQAMLTMIKRQGKYILVTEQGRPIGVVTIGDLTKARTTSTFTIVRAIDEAENSAELASAIEPLKLVVAAMLSEKAPANEICEVTSELNDLLVKRLLYMAEDALSQQGLGGAPADYCWLNLGSGGRQEQAIGSYQYNAIIYADPPRGMESQYKNYFTSLADLVVDGLSQCGLQQNPSSVTADKPDWCRSLSSWKAAIRACAGSSEPESACRFGPFFDFRPVYGREHLARELKEYTLRLFRVAPPILYQMAGSDLSRRVPLDLLKQLFQEIGTWPGEQIDLKQTACIHIVDCIRIFALREGLQETSTLGRLDKLVELQAFSPDDAEYFEAAFQSLMLFRIQENLRKASTGLAPDNRIDPGNLSRRQRSVLREGLIAIDRLQTITAASFKLGD